MNTTRPNLVLSNALSPGDDAQVKRFLREFNQQANPDLWAKLEQGEHDPHPLHVAVYRDEREIAGGLLATTSMSWLKIDIMAVCTSCRRQGLGTQMLQAAEQEAVQRGCKYAFVDTMEHQAPGFYRKNGYDVVGTIADWDSHGHAKYYLTKKLRS